MLKIFPFFQVICIFGYYFRDLFTMHDLSFPGKNILKKWAEEYECKEFIAGDPIQFPHRFKDIRDIEVSAFLVSWFTYGNRKQIIKKGNELMALMDERPYDYLMKGNWAILRNDHKSFYRFYKYKDLYILLQTLHHIYKEHASLESFLQSFETPCQGVRETFQQIRGIPSPGTASACKKIHMFLRWMVRQDSPVDLGVWKSFDPATLILPLDVHVHRMGLNLSITQRKAADIKTALEITEFFKEIFPNDPCKGDFSLFGYAINNKSL